MSASRGHVRRFVLDANALVSFFEIRPGSAIRVRHLLEQAARSELPVFLSAVNWGEFFYIAWRLHGETRAREAEGKLRHLPIVVIAAELRSRNPGGRPQAKTQSRLRDAFAAELAIERHAHLVTADPEFTKLGKHSVRYDLPRYEK